MASEPGQLHGDGFVGSISELPYEPCRWYEDGDVGFIDALACGTYGNVLPFVLYELYGNVNAGFIDALASELGCTHGHEGGRWIDVVACELGEPYGNALPCTPYEKACLGLIGAFASKPSLGANKILASYLISHLAHGSFVTTR